MQKQRARTTSDLLRVPPKMERLTADEHRAIESARTLVKYFRVDRGVSFEDATRAQDAINSQMEAERNIRRVLDGSRG